MACKCHLPAPVNCHASRCICTEHHSSSNSTVQLRPESSGSPSISQPPAVLVASSSLISQPHSMSVPFSAAASSSSNPSLKPHAELVAFQAPLFLDIDTCPPTPARLTVWPLLSNCLSNLDVSLWQDDICDLKKVKKAQEAQIKGPSSVALAMFLVKALKCLLQNEQVPANDLELGVSAANIPDVYSLLVPFPSFLL